MTLCTVCQLPLAVGEFPCVKTIRPHGRAHVSVVDDSCDITQEHFGHQPEHFTSKQAMARRAKELGLMPFVRHVGVQGSDKNPNTQRWI